MSNDILKVLTEGSGKSLEECAAAVGVTVMTWRRWMAGTAVPGGASVFAIADLFGVEVDALRPITKKKAQTAATA